MALRQLSPDLQERAIKEINEDPERIKTDIQQIKDWLAKQPNLNVRPGDQWLLTFLRGCKFSLERTKEKLDMFYTMRTVIPEFFKDRDPLRAEFQDILKLGILIPLPTTLGPDGPVVFLMRSGCYQPDKISASHIFKNNFFISDILLNENDNYCISGLTILVDMANVTLSHMVQFTPALIKKTMTCFQEGYPIRPKGIHFIHTPTGFETLFNLFKSFSKEKLKKRMYVHNEDMESLYKFIPQSMLPAEYGGNAGSVDKLAADWKNKVESYRDWLIEDETFFSDERLRVGKPKTADDLFGVDGSFRQLAID